MNIKVKFLNKLKETSVGN